VAAASAIVIPCYNEEARLDVPRVVELARDPGLSLVLVDDGSRDGTFKVLERVAAESGGKASVLRMEKNGGKGEAVRRGMLEALGAGARVVGYADADLSTPPREIVRLVDELAESDQLDVVIASRVLMVGRRIERRVMRHYLGRVFATLAANILRTPFYDTQCGAKVFRATPTLSAALSRPFTSRWGFDVELLGRLLVGMDGAPGIPIDRVREIPVEEWTDVPGSKLHVGSMAKTLVELGKIELELDKLRAEKRRGRA
jgi:glycosyltransferase involved in cell wall biosynthesis